MHRRRPRPSARCLNVKHVRCTSRIYYTTRSPRLSLSRRRVRYTYCRISLRLSYTLVNILRTYVLCVLPIFFLLPITPSKLFYTVLYYILYVLL